MIVKQPEKKTKEMSKNDENFSVYWQLYNNAIDISGDQKETQMYRRRWKWRIKSKNVGGLYK